MPEAEETVNPSQAHAPDATGISWTNFLETHPPDKRRTVKDMGRHMVGLGPNFVINAPEITLNCDSTICGGNRKFRCTDGSSNQLPYNQWAQCFLTYTCRNCGKKKKIYALRCHWHLKQRPTGRAGPAPVLPGPPIFDEEWQEAIKLGESPPLGPVLPRKLLKLVESDRALFELGRRAEGQGMGIGAFAYYRRVVENLRLTLFDKLIAAAERIKADAEIIEKLKANRENWQFTQSVEDLKSALPEQLKVEGQNPLA